MLRCISYYFNPNNSEKIRQDFKNFKDNFNGPLIVAEVAFEDQSFWIDDSIRIQANDSNRMWQGHRLINIALQSLPTNIDKVAWVNPNIIMENFAWARNTSELLDFFPVTQLCSYVDNDNLAYVIKSKQHADYDIKVNNQAERIGRYDVGWAAQRSQLPQGVFDFGIEGSCDIYQLLSWQGAWDNRYFMRLDPEVRMQIMQKTMDDFMVVKNNIGFIDGNINTLSESRTNHYDILNQHNFNIEQDIQLDENGLWQWASDKTDFHKDIADIL
tara:strand:+ start:2200 stop:3012 length:813 start_codon:yes stop_codon:yes gene_type:complete